MVVNRERGKRRNLMTVKREGNAREERKGSWNGSRKLKDGGKQKVGHGK